MVNLRAVYIIWYRDILRFWHDKMRLMGSITMPLLFLLFFIGTRNMKLVPSGLQNFLELIVEAAANFIEDPAGEKHGRWFFPVCTTIFLFVVANAWLSLIPGFETIHVHGEPLLRNANTDLNIPAALAVVSFIFVEYCQILKCVGFT